MSRTISPDCTLRPDSSAYEDHHSDERDTDMWDPARRGERIVDRTGFTDRAFGVHGTDIKFWEGHMLFILWLIAVVLVISGIVTLIRGQVLFGILLIIVGLLVGPGGVSIFT
jgi:hypothetical protein